MGLSGNGGTKREWRGASGNGGALSGNDGALSGNDGAQAGMTGRKRESLKARERRRDARAHRNVGAPSNPAPLDAKRLMLIRFRVMILRGGMRRFRRRE